MIQVNEGEKHDVTHLIHCIIIRDRVGVGYDPLWFTDEKIRLSVI